MDERPIPPAATRDPKSVELARVWSAERALHCSLKIGTYDGTRFLEEEAWGIILADMAKHVANAIHEMRNVPRERILLAIAKSFSSEIEKPTSVAKGKFKD
jgi:hypothetical protein